MQGKLAFLHHRTTFERTPASALATFEKFRPTEPIMLGHSTTAFAANPHFLTMRFQVNFTAFLIRKLVDKVDDVHDFGYFNQVTSLLIPLQLIVTTCHYLVTCSYPNTHKNESWK